MSRLKQYFRQLRELSHKFHIRVGILVFLITLASFGIGYLIGRDWTPAPIVIQKIENSK